jgi:parvulin-like peptidyl-prolyl isomerase
MKLKASHILLSHKDANPPTHSRGIAVCMTVAEEIIRDIRSGKVSFEQSARENSACPSKERGGDLGWFEEEAMVTEFSSACKNIQKDDLGPPCISPFGVHIILRTG